ncbi:hypothetical protein B1no1_19080 [Thermolongibacillus altinsuensis]|nr:hypothetical protein B1no1_19080 [Thermolongibacillus altinsuensis]
MSIREMPNGAIEKLTLCKHIKAVRESTYGWKADIAIQLKRVKSRWRCIKQVDVLRRKQKNNFQSQSS